MRDFDNFYRTNQNIYFYSRFVDDIIIITSGYEDKSIFIEDLEKNLKPLQLSLNTKKQYNKKVERTNKSINSTVCSFDYLGYNFKVSNPPSSSKNNKEKHPFRKIKIDIAEKKVKKIKTRIILSLLSYIETGDFDTLHSRLKLLTGNYSLVDRKQELKGKQEYFTITDMSMLQQEERLRS